MNINAWRVRVLLGIFLAFSIFAFPFNIAQAETEEDAYFNYLDRDVPGWEDINKSSRFLTWLDNAVEPSSGKSYGKILEDSWHTKNAPMASIVFKMP